jgi:hypothetical protein
VLKNSAEKIAPKKIAPILCLALSKISRHGAGKIAQKNCAEKKKKNDGSKL